MQRKRNKFLALSFVLLAVACAGLYVISIEDVKPDINQDLFKIDTDKIDLVIMQSLKGKTELKFENSQWKVNDKWVADNSMINVLFATLKQVEPRRPVALSLRDSVKMLLEQKGTRVSLSQAGESKGEFYVGGNFTKTETWFMKVGDSQPYTMMIPGYRVYIGGILELDETGWRNKRIFEFNWRNFRSLSSTYFKDPKQNFTIEMKNGMFAVAEISSSDTTKVNNYLDAISLLFASKFIAQGRPQMDSLIAAGPGVKIEIKDIANRSFTLDLFAPQRKNSEVYARLGDGQIVALEKKDAMEIVRTRSFFILKP